MKSLSILEVQRLFRTLPMSTPGKKSSRRPANSFAPADQVCSGTRTPNFEEVIPHEN